MIKTFQKLLYVTLLFFSYNSTNAQLVSSDYFHFDIKIKDSLKFAIESIRCLKIDTAYFLEAGFDFPSSLPNEDKTLYSIHLKNQHSQENIQIYFYIDNKSYSTIIPLRGIFRVILPDSINEGTYCFNLFDINFSKSNMALKEEYDESVNFWEKQKKNKLDVAEIAINKQIENVVYNLKSKFYLFYPVNISGGFANNTIVEVTAIGMSSNKVSGSIIAPNVIEEYIKNPQIEKPEAVKKILSVFDEIK
ncbi:MAG: hypothetical protein PHQ74_00825 [Crocinitomicaceae bacterium]|nr:hypothetical protein [Crocinitomicaceae bacterium]